jgi:hypothetical protein
MSKYACFVLIVPNFGLSELFCILSVLVIDVPLLKHAINLAQYLL